MPEEKVLLLDKGKGIGTITLNGPDKLNAFNDELSFALQDALRDCEKDSAVKVLVITGAGRGFCSGKICKPVWNRRLLMMVNQLLH